MYLVLVNNHHFVKSGLRSNSSYVLSIVWVSDPSDLPSGLSLLWISERLSSPLLQSKCIGDTVHL